LPLSVSVLFVCFHPKVVIRTVVDIRTRIQFSLRRTLGEVKGDERRRHLIQRFVVVLLSAPSS
jgi:hypothetical protein